MVKSVFIIGHNMQMRPNADDILRLNTDDISVDELRGVVYKHCDARDFLTATVFIPIIEQGVKLRGNYFVFDGDIKCSLYCEDIYIRELFESDGGCKIYIESDSLLAGSICFGKHDFPYTLRKLNDQHGYCEFNYTIKKGLFDSITNKIHKLYVCANSSTGMHYHIDPPHIDIELMVSPKIYKNTVSHNDTINDHIIDILKQLSDEELSLGNRGYAFRMLGAFSSYISGCLKHDKYVQILQEYNRYIYNHDNEHNFHEFLHNNTNIEEIVNFGISALCNIYATTRNNTYGALINDIIMFVTNDVELSKHFVKNPILLVCNNVNYTVSKYCVYKNLKKFITIFANINNSRQKKIHKMINILQNFKDMI